jgi:predicted deacylase
LIAAFTLGLGAQEPEQEQISTETRPIEKQVRQTFEFRDERVYFSSEFDGARANMIEKDEHGRYVITILPENAPINMSPWYAFKVWSRNKKDIEVQLVYPDYAVHRYDPKISRDGRMWRPLERERITDIEKGTADSGPRSRPKSVILRLTLDKKPLWVSAQELQTSTHVFEWMDALAKRGTFKTKTIGLSREGRPLRMLTIGNPASKNMMLVISRQHPPEVTGYFAMQAFVEKLADDSELSTQFRREWCIYVIPLMNPDGVDGGHWRHNAGGIDLNRDWSDFHQPETNYVRDLLAQRAAATAGRFYFGIDFHSTWNDIYYPFTSVYEGNAPRLVHRWLENIQAALPNYSPRIQANPRLYPTRVSRNYFFDKYGMEAIVFEIGDNTPRDFIRRKGEVAAVEMMRLLIAGNQRMDGLNN